MAASLPWLSLAPARAQEPVSWTWSGENVCSAPEAPNRDIARLLGERYASLEAQQFAVEITSPGPDTYDLRFRFADAPLESARTLQLHSCGEVREAAILLAAMALDPTLSLPELASEPPAKPQAPPAPPPPTPKPAPQAKPSWKGGLELAGFLDGKNLPQLGVGPDLAVTAVHKALRLGLHGRYLTAPPQSPQVATGEARLSLLAAALELGAAWPLGRLRAGPTSELELGYLWGRAKDVSAARSSGTLWASAWGGLGLGFQAHPRLSLSARGLLGVPLVRPQFALHGDTPFFTTPNLSYRVFLALAWCWGSKE